MSRSRRFLGMGSILYSVARRHCVGHRGWTIRARSVIADAGTAASKVALNEMNLGNVFLLRALCVGTAVLPAALRHQGLRQARRVLADRTAFGLIILTEGLLAFASRHGEWSPEAMNLLRINAPELDGFSNPGHGQHQGCFSQGCILHPAVGQHFGEGALHHLLQLCHHF